MEIERKFRLTRDNPFDSLADGEYFVEKQTVTFVDRYFDDICHTLSVNDHWLRRRTYGPSRALWELKCPQQRSKCAVDEGHCTHYMEVSDTQQIATCVRELLKGRAENASFEEILKGLNCWCEIKTSRQTFELMVRESSFPITVVIDSFDNERIGEVEIMLPQNHSSREVEAAEKVINDVFLRFGLESASGGKVERFIKKEKPELFEKIKHLLKK